MNQFFHSIKQIYQLRSCIKLTEVQWIRELILVLVLEFLSMLVIRTSLVLATQFGNIQRQSPSRAHAHTSLHRDMFQQMFQHAKQKLQLLLAELIQSANTTIRNVSNLRLGFKSSIFLEMPHNGLAKQTNLLEPNLLAWKAPLMPSGLLSSLI